MNIREYTEKFNDLDFDKQEWREIGYYSILRPIGNIAPLCEIAFDCGKRYKEHDNGLVFFLKNGYTDDSEWIPFTVEDHPQPLLEFERKITLKDYFAVLKLVSYNQNTIREHANIKTGTLEFIPKLREKKQSLLSEMPNLTPMETGLPYGVWLDKSGTFKRGGHWMRIKVIKEKGDYAIYTIPDHEWISDNGMKAWEKHVIEKFVEYNEEDFIKFFLGKITESKLMERLIMVNDRGEAVNPEAKKDWFLYKEAGFGYKIVINSYTGKFNYMNKEGDIMLPDSVDRCSEILNLNGKLSCNTTNGDEYCNYNINNHKFVLISKSKIFTDERYKD